MKRINDRMHDRWSDLIKKRDGYKCVICGKYSKWNHAHHLDGYDWFVMGRYELRNGVTLCGGKNGCHMKFHNKYGRGKNTIHQFKEFQRDNTKRH